MDVELEQVEERIIDKVDGAVDILFDAEVELERAAGLVACESRDVGELSRFIGNVFAGVTVCPKPKTSVSPLLRYVPPHNVHCSVQARHWNWLADFVTWLRERFLLRCGGEGSVESDDKAENE